MIIGIDASRAFGKQRTGTEEYTYQMLRQLLDIPQAQDHTWILYTKSDVQVAWLNYTNVLVRPIRLPRLWTQVGLAATTWKDKLDVLWVPAHTLPVLRRPGLPTAVTVHGIEYEYLPSYENWLQRWYLPLSTQYAVWSATRVIAVSDFTKSQLIDRLGADSQKITVISEGVALQRPIIPKKVVDTVLQKFGLTAKKYLVFIGTVQPRKNLRRLIEAYIDMAETGYDLVVIGKLGWGYSDLPIDQNPHIKFLKYVPESEKQVLLANAAAYVQPSITEGFGLPILEAFAAEIPVVSSSGGALAEVVGPAGLLFDPYNVAQMTEQMRRVIKDSKLRKQLIAAGKQQLTKFTWQQAGRKTYNMLTNVR